MKFLDLFAGIGGFRLGMEYAGHECVGFCEIDKFARASYKAIHDTEGEVEMHDITTVSDEFVRGIGSVDIICGGFPCQAFSIAGKRKGFEDTRGTLFFEIARFASILRPRYLFLENVKGLLNHERGATFETILRALDELGYDVEWQVLNSKDYVPQNRERVFIIGHLRGERVRKVFPFERDDQSLVELQIQQSSVNTITARYGEAAGVGSYVIESKQQKQVAIPVLTPDRIEKRQNGRRFKNDGDEMFTLTAQDRHGIMVAGKLPGNHDQNSRVYNSVGIAPTLSTMQGGGTEPKILIKEATTKGYAEALPGDSVNISHPNSETRRGRVGKGIANTLLTGEEQAVVTDNYRIRKLTPRECWRLQGFPDWAFDRAKQVNSDSQLYKQAGNSVTVPVIADIAKRL
ncbi:DNA (cytosine-5-)-methyltransferase [Enterococcus mundtii]|uniref:DNA (cytosine-5-)-methyltransferase n=1 Tax=Enterococcus mundtii TaxID=53346 RepID=UPI002542BD2C|nr:DNA (cytosine-5-)-methyltransferase [Enterococcus mundtii]MDK4211322.1 DNA (cytosine-5-)-methyltransferase [Enterococcus mundtii]